MTQAIPQHSSATPEHYTPPEYLVAARAVMGSIDLDPASTHSVNVANVHAKQIFTKADDGLVQSWHGRVWLNPPGGKLKKIGGVYVPIEDGPGESSAAVWWAKLADEYASGRVTQALFLAFTLEILRSTQGAAIWPGALPFCVPDSRIRFLREVDGGFVVGKSPTHANVIAYLAPKDDGGAADRFVAEFSKFGLVSIPRPSGGEEQKR